MPVGPVSEGSDDQSLVATGILIAIDEVDVSDGDLTLVGVLDVIEATLLQPLEVARRFNVHFHLYVYDYDGIKTN